MKKVTSKKSQTYQSDVKGTTVKIDYRATIEVGETVETVETIYGTVAKGGSKVGSVNFSGSEDHVHITFEPFSATTFAEKKAIAAAAVANLEVILNENQGDE